MLHLVTTVFCIPAIWYNERKNNSNKVSNIVRILNPHVFHVTQNLWTAFSRMRTIHLSNAEYQCSRILSTASTANPGNALSLISGLRTGN